MPASLDGELTSIIGIRNGLVPGRGFGAGAGLVFGCLEEPDAGRAFAGTILCFIGNCG